jgi:hypothetical protein
VWVGAEAALKRESDALVSQGASDLNYPLLLSKRNNRRFYFEVAFDVALRITLATLAG